MEKQKRKLKKDDFAVEVEGVGNFIFAYRTMRDEFRIQAEYSRLTEGVITPSLILAEQATIFATLNVLTVESPEGWELSEMDPLDPETYDKVKEVYNALREKEDFFRKGPEQGSESQGEGNGGDNGVLGQETVRTGAD